MAQVTNFTEYFKEERDIYVQNISNCQVSVAFELGSGHVESFLFTNSKDPVNLTRYIPFNAIKSSMDFRRMLNRQPQALMLMPEQEYKMYYERQAQRLGLSDMDEALKDAEIKRMAAQNHTPLKDATDPIKIHEVVEDGTHMGEKKLVRPLEQVSEQDEIHPRILHLCLQVHPSVADQQKMTAIQMLSEIDGVPDMKITDWEYLQSHSYYKSIKNLARKKVAELANAATASEPEEEEVKPVPKKGKK